jgi:predicted dienelactone hydrolase
MTRLRVVALAAVALAAAVAGFVVAAQRDDVPARHRARRTASPARSASPAAPAPARPHRPFAVAFRRIVVVDRPRTVRRRDGRVVPRTLVTDVRYPAAAVGRPYPLVVFGHGFDLLPSTYARLMDAWARAGYVVAAPAFPLERANAPGGPDESDLSNQPADVSCVITRLLRLSAARRGPLRGLIDPHAIAAGGHSDGAATAEALAFDGADRDPRVRAVLLLSGAGVSGLGTRPLPRRAPALLAIQGTADPVHPPSSTVAFFGVAGRPKYLLRLLGAGHEAPYTVDARLRRLVERVTVAFFDRYLRRQPAAARRLVRDGRVPGVATLVARP